LGGLLNGSHLKMIFDLEKSGILRKHWGPLLLVRRRILVVLRKRRVMWTFRFAENAMIKVLNSAKVGLVVMTGAFVLSAGSPAEAFDPQKVFKSGEDPLAIMKYGFDAYKNGRKDEALGAFRYAAGKNQLAAKWKLGRMYAIGDGVKRDDVAAFKLYREIAEQYADIRPRRRDRIFVSNAIVAVADYYRSGIAGTNIKPNIGRAVEYYIRAGALYGNGHAQYQLGRIYLEGQMGKSQPVQAARWLRAAGKKKHPAAQAVLGRMLFEGNGVRRNRVQGLMLMTMAVEYSARGRFSRQQGWIDEWREAAFKKASRSDRAKAMKLVERSFASTPGANNRKISSIRTKIVQELPVIDR